MELRFKENMVAPTSVTYDLNTGKSCLNVRLPIIYVHGRIRGVLDHEIGTHYMRTYNERFQLWHKKRDQCGMKTCLKTEEGLACVNFYVTMVSTANGVNFIYVKQAWDKNKHPFIYRVALNYYGAYMASKMSFVELFEDINKYLDDPMTCWKYTVRWKRGIVDT